MRDNIPAIITADGYVPVTRTLTEEEYKQALLAKLVEEAQELFEGNVDMGERADVEEVLRAFDTAFGYTREEVEAARAEKARLRGGFNQRILLEKIDER